MYFFESGAHCARYKKIHYFHLKSRYILKFKDLTNIGQLHSGRVQKKTKYMKILKTDIVPAINFLVHSDWSMTTLVIHQSAVFD